MLYNTAAVQNEGLYMYVHLHLHVLLFKNTVDNNYIIFSNYGKKKKKQNVKKKEKKTRKKNDFFTHTHTHTRYSLFFENFHTQTHIEFLLKYHRFENKFCTYLFQTKQKIR